MGSAGVFVSFAVLAAGADSSLLFGILFYQLAQFSVTGHVNLLFPPQRYVRGMDYYVNAEHPEPCGGIPRFEKCAFSINK